MSAVFVTVESANRLELEGKVDADILEFSEFFKSLGNDGLARSEKAIIKTYLAWKLGLMKR